MRIVIGFPITSAATQPKIRSAPMFHEVMTPSRFLLTIASSEDSMMAARRACATTRGSSSSGLGAGFDESGGCTETPPLHGEPPPLQHLTNAGK
jgi:hypothetical protein